MSTNNTTSYSDLHVRLDTDIKNKAEGILGELGIAPSNAVNMFYRQVIAHDGLPFRVVRREDPLPNLDEMTKEEFNAMIDEALEGIDKGEYRPADEVFRDILGDKFDEI